MTWDDMIFLIESLVILLFVGFIIAVCYLPVKVYRWWTKTND